MSCGVLVCTTTCEPSIAFGYSQCSRTSTGDYHLSHKVNTDVTMQVSGFTLPMAKTTRDFSFTFDQDVATAGCDETAKWNMHGTISDSIAHESCILYFLDLAAGVCLYKKRVASISLNGSGTTKVDVNVGGYTASFCGVEAGLSITYTDTFYFIHNGQQDTLFSEDHSEAGPIYFYAPTPGPNERGNLVYGPPEWIDRPYYNSYATVNEENPGDFTWLDGGRDMFFPEWARNFVNDPVWRDAATHRWLILKYPASVYPEFAAALLGLLEYQFEPTVVPLPVGDYVNHPELGEFYSWLIEGPGDGFTLVNKSGAFPLLEELSKEVVTGSLLNFYPVALL